MGYRPMSAAKLARFGKLEAESTCDYCKATLAVGARIYRAPNGETYGIDCHRGTVRAYSPDSGIQLKPKRTLEEQDFHVAARKYAKNRRISAKGFVQVYIQGNHSCSWCGHEIPKGHIAWISRSNMVYHHKRTQCTLADAAQLSHDFRQAA